MNKKGLAILWSLLILLVLSCKKDELDFNKFSDRIAIGRQLAAPLAFGNLNIIEMAENNGDSLIVIDGDTVKLVFRQDSIFYASIQEFLGIPQQPTQNYTISPDADSTIPPPPGIVRVEFPDLIKDTLFPFATENSMRIDSIYLNQSNLNINVENNFQQTTTLIIRSSSLKSPSGIFFIDSIENIGPGQNISVQFPIDNYTVISYPDSANNYKSSLSLRLIPVVYITPTENSISQTNNLSIDFGIDQIEDFDALFGFFGYQTHSIDTVLNDFTPELFKGLEGTLNVTNPKLKLRYQNSSGVAASIDMLLNLQYASSSDVAIDLGQKIMGYSDNILAPAYQGVFNYDRNTVVNIDQLISLPMAETINTVADGELNPSADSLTTNNWALHDSELKIDLELEVPLELSANLTYSDTIKIRDDNPTEANESYEIEYAELHYTFENYFPLGFGGELIAYDSIANETLDTIKLNQTGSMLIEPAPVDGAGNVVRSQVIEYKDKIVIDARSAEIILNEATHLIFRATLITTNYNSVRVGTDSELNFQFGIDAKGKYIVN